MYRKITIKTIFILLIITMLNINPIFALEPKNVYIEKLGDHVSYLQYDGKAIRHYLTGYNENGSSYMAYCIDPSLPGVGEIGSYSAQIDGQIQDPIVVRIIQNGYPYKSPQELGVNDDNEAYYATKCALWAYIKGINVNDYIALNSECERVKNATALIYTNGVNSSNNTTKEQIDIIPIGNTYIDTISPKYLSQTYNIAANYNIEEYKVEIISGKIDEGTKITDVNNIEKSEFQNGEKFKILIPADNIAADVNSIGLKITTTLKTEKVLFGVAKEGAQNHAVTMMPIEDIEKELIFTYKQVYGQIQIIKTSKEYNKYTKTDANSPLEGAEFKVYNEQGELVDEIVTDKFGKATTKLLKRGKYKVVESMSPEFYLMDLSEHETEIIYPDGIVDINIKNENVELKVDIFKNGKYEVKANEEIEYELDNIGNYSNVSLEEFYVEDIIPTDATRLTKIQTGTYNKELLYKVIYRTNLNDEYRLLKDNLSTNQNYTLSCDTNSLNLEPNEFIIQIRFEFGKVGAGFKANEKPLITAIVMEGLPNRL